MRVSRIVAPQPGAAKSTPVVADENIIALLKDMLENLERAETNLALLGHATLPSGLTGADASAVTAGMDIVKSAVHKFAVKAVGVARDSVLLYARLENADGRHPQVARE